MNKENIDNIQELIMTICKQVDGVGPAYAGTIATDFEGDLHEFLNADKSRFELIMTSRGKSVLKDEQIEQLLTLIKPLDSSASVNEAWVFWLGREFLKTQVAMVESLSFETFDINPLLATALNLETPREIIAFNAYQTITRSIVTSWGDSIEKIAKYVGCKSNDEILEGKKGTNFDLVKKLNGTDYYIQVKSGPNSMNVGMVTSLNEAIKKVEKEKKGAKGILGITYGNQEMLSGQIGGNLDDIEDKLLLGRAFWDFISESENFHNELLSILDESSKGILSESFIDMIENKITKLEQQWFEKHNEKPLAEVLRNYI